jgi:tellurite resistance protein TerC
MQPTFAFISGPIPWLALMGVTIVFLTVDLKFFARGREPSFREGVIWSIGWLVVALLVAPVVWVLSSGEDAVTYTTVYFIERSLSLDNLFVFLLLFSYFGVPQEYRANLLFYGIVAALILRGLAILGGVALIEQFHFVIYILGVLLLVLAWRILKGVEEGVDPDRNLIVRGVRKLFPVSGEFHGHHWFVKLDGTRHATPIFLCLAAIVAADIAFAVDSIPAAFAITRDSVLIWMGNIFALLGLRALFVLVEGLIRRFRYLDQTIAVVLALVAVKLLIEDIYKLGPVASLALVAAAFAVGITASLIADSRDPDADAKRAERSGRTTHDGGPPQGEPEPEPEPVARD